jgi:sugar phosphate isomerase/epimerase
MTLRLGHHANAWGGVVGHPVGVTSIKDLFYLTPGDTLLTLRAVADAGYEGVELFDGNLAEFAGEPGVLRDALGLVATFHRHLTTIVESPEDVEWVLRSSRIGFCPDTGHLQAGGGDPVQLVRDYRHRIPYIHLKDIDAQGTFVPLGDGVLDIAGVVDVLRETGYDGWIMVETDGWPGDPGEGARRSIAKLRGLLAHVA